MLHSIPHQKRTTSHGWNFHWKKHVGTTFFMSITGRPMVDCLDGGQHPNLPTIFIEEISWQSWNFSISDLHLPRETTGCTGSTGRNFSQFCIQKTHQTFGGKEWENKNSFTIVSHHTTKNIHHIHQCVVNIHLLVIFFDTKLLLKIFSSCGLRSRPLESEVFTRINKMNSRDWCKCVEHWQSNQWVPEFNEPIEAFWTVSNKAMNKKNNSFNSCHLYVKRNPNSAEIWAPLIITNSFGSAAEWNKASPFLANKQSRSVKQVTYEVWWLLRGWPVELRLIV